MTIAAGFVCEEGVLLCADTEPTGWSSKFHGSKVEHFEIRGGKIAFALTAANSHLAWSAIQKCRDRLQAVVPKDVVVELEQILDAEYRRQVLTHPSYSDGLGETLFRVGQTNVGKDVAAALFDHNPLAHLSSKTSAVVSSRLGATS